MEAYNTASAWMVLGPCIAIAVVGAVSMITNMFRDNKKTDLKIAQEVTKQEELKLERTKLEREPQTTT